MISPISWMQIQWRGFPSHVWWHRSVNPLCIYIYNILGFSHHCSYQNYILAISLSNYKNRKPPCWGICWFANIPWNITLTTHLLVLYPLVSCLNPNYWWKKMPVNITKVVGHSKSPCVLVFYHHLLIRKTTAFPAFDGALSGVPCLGQRSRAPEENSWRLQPSIS